MGAEPATLEPRRTRRPDRRTRRAAREVAFGAVLAGLVLLAGPGAAWTGLLALVTIVVLVLMRLFHVRRGPPSRVAAVAAGIMLAVAALAYVGAMLGPSNSTLGIRSVEWMRDNGARGLVNSAERLWYSLTAPSKGGPGLANLPSAGIATPGAAQAGSPRKRLPARALPHSYRPHRLRAVLSPALPGEGVWHPTQARFASRAASPPVLVTTYRPSADYPRIVAGVAWFDHMRTRIALIPGIKEPPSGRFGSSEVPPSKRASLLATFNSGFKHHDSGGGFYTQGRLLEPLVPGVGSIVGLRNGRMDVRAWSGGSRPGRGISFVRQNLPLIVDHGRINPNLSDGPAWGATLGNAILVWRSGVGVDRRGNLIYAAAPEETVGGMARILLHAGAVRAVELDINSYWVTLNTYAYTGARGARALLPAMHRSAQRYLSPDDRDFFAVYLHKGS